MSPSKHGQKHLNVGQKKDIKKMLKNHDAKMLQLKYNDLNTSWSPAQASGYVSVAPAATLVEGDGDNERIGDSISPQKLHIKLFTTYSPLGANDVSNLGIARQLRTMVVIDRICDGNGVTNVDLFENNNSAYTAISALNQVHQLNNPKRFIILYDKTVNLVRGTSASSFKLDRVFDLSKHGKSKFIANTGNTAALGMNNVFVVQTTNSATTADIGTMFYSRLTFKDA